MNDGKYTDLSQDHKREMLVNLNALFLATFGLAKVSEVDFENVSAEVWEPAFDQINSLSDAEVDHAIAALEKKHRPFKQPGEAVVQKIERQDSGSKP